MSAEPSIIHEDEYLIVLQKPSLMHSVNTRHGSDHSVATWLAKERPLIVTASPKEEDCGIANRLDYETSGLLLASKDRDTYQKLSELTKASRIKKIYLAHVEGIFSASVTVNKAIGARGRRSDLSRVFDNPKPRDRALSAITRFAPISIGSTSSIISAEITQGRRHQIRVHAKSLGHSLVGDLKYGSQTGEDFILHSWKISFEHPVTSKLVEYTAPLPERLMALRKEGVWRDLFENIFS